MLEKDLIYSKDKPELLSPLSVLEIWTDGGTTNNGKADAFGGWSFVGIENGKKPIIGFSEHCPGIITNNRCEIMGVIAAILHLATPDRKLIIRSDSQYVVKTVNEWRHGWARKKDQSAILNKELFEQLFHLVDNNHVSLEWVKGHASSVGNNIADFWATKAMKKEKPTEKHLTQADFVYFNSIKGFM
ncbi:putative RNaseH ribonuclease [Acinetobacter phage SH-Ab 15599]|nr:putative RNaseH ribonuclease [Acinetobacter phage SH-Ab 15599]